jgi:hypothetical protein
MAHTGGVRGWNCAASKANMSLTLVRLPPSLLAPTKANILRRDMPPQTTLRTRRHPLARDDLRRHPPRAR